MARRKRGSVSQKAMVLAAIEAKGWDAVPAELQPVIKEQFNVELPNNVISNYKSVLKSKGAKGTGAKRGRKPGPQFADLEAVRGLVSRLGVDQVKKLVDMADLFA